MEAERKGRTKPKATDERLLDTAERLFARQGIRATSLREITEQTGINIAAVNYHFRSKEALVRAVYERSFKPLNEERLRCLAEAEAAAGDGPLAIEEVLRALFGPMLRAWEQNRNYILLSGRLQHEPDPGLHEFILQLFDEMIRRFLAAASRALPGAPETDLFFWFHYLFGGMVHTLLAAQDLERLPGGSSILDDRAKFLDLLIQFGSAGLRSIPGTPATARPEFSETTVGAAASMSEDM
jgi:AcrR family transcriptional regulator